MATNVTVNAGQGSTQVTVITGEGSTSYSVSTGARGPTGATGPAATVDQTIIDGSANAVAGNAVFDALELVTAKLPLYAADYGVIAGNSSDAIAEANAVALTTAAAAASTLKRTLQLNGTIYIKGQWLISGSDINIFGNEATIIQKDITHNGMTADTVNAPNKLVVEGVNFTGQGAATHDAAGFRAARDDGAFFMSDAFFRNCLFVGWRRAFKVTNTVKFETTNVSITGCRIGYEMFDVQTFLIIAARITQGDSHADSACFSIDGTLSFASKILYGEFGGTGIARFASITNGWLNVESANMEAFTSNQVVNMTGQAISKRIEFRNCRLAFGRTATQSFISSECSTVGVGLPMVTLDRNVGGETFTRPLEIWGIDPTSMIYGPTVVGREIKTAYAQTQGGTILQTRYEQADRQGRVLDAVARLSIADGTDITVCTHTIPVGVLNRVGQTVRLCAAGSTAANANTKQFKVKVGATTAVDFGAIAMNASSWRIEAEMMYGAFGGGGGNWKLSAQLFYDSTVVTRTWDLSGSLGNTAVAFAVTATTPAAGDVIKTYHKITAQREKDVY